VKTILAKNHQLSRANESSPEIKNQTKLIGQSEAMKRIHSTIDMVADSPTPVLISGESGTGKEVVAHLIHERSPRQDRPFLAINCAALPKDIFENELFGHDQGAYTGANGRKEGYLEMANGGTLFFDEMAEMHPDIQAKLLRVLETKSFRRLGGKEEVKVDIRTLAATNKDVQLALKTGDLRLDLYYRFSVIEIHLPPLRERKEDIPLLIDGFLESLCVTHKKDPMTVSTEALEAILRYDWPGNVRELHNVIERAVIISSFPEIDPQVLPERIIGKVRTTPKSITIPMGTSLQEVEKIVIQQTLASVGNNKTKAAKVLGLSRKSLHNKLGIYNNPLVDD